jgi:hypothetical protein
MEGILLTNAFIDSDRSAIVLASIVVIVLSPMLVITGIMHSVFTVPWRFIYTLVASLINASVVGLRQEYVLLIPILADPYVSLASIAG